MSVIHLTQIKDRIHKLFDGKIDLSDVVNEKTPKEQVENLFLSRALAAYALHFLAGATDIEAAAAVTDGGDDNGIDAIYFDSRERTLYLVQSKWIHSGIGEPENGDVKKFVAGVRDLFNLLFDRFNQKVRDKFEVVNRALTDPSSRYEIVVIYTGANSLAEPSSRDLDDLVKDMNDTSEVLSLSVLNQASIYNSLTAALSGEPINLDIGLRSWGRVDSPHIAFYGQADGGQIADWWTKHRSRLFGKNLRGVLGDTEVNDEIRASIEKVPDLFWYFNNGVTLICKTIAKTMAGGADTVFGTFHCSDVSVVNGAQTVSTIGKYSTASPESAEKAKKIYVPLRLISLEKSDESFGVDVTKTNNRQNRIENRDFVSLDPEQMRLRTELLINGIDYHLMRTESFVRSASSFDLVESTTALACASGDINLVVQLKREIGRLWENVKKAPYRQLFNPQVNGIFVWNCVRIQREIDAALEKALAGSAFKAGKKYGIGVHGNRVIAAMVFRTLGPKQFADPAFSVGDFLKNLDLGILVVEAHNKLADLVEKEYGNPIVPTLFKNLTKCKTLYDLAK